MATTVKIGDREVGAGHPCFIIGEIGLNHNGDLDIAKKLIDAAAVAGCDAVKFQKRTPDICVPKDQRDVQRETPWGVMSYMDYRYRVEFDADAYRQIDAWCRERGLMWTASCWDEPSVDFIEQFKPAFHKVASATITDSGLMKKLAASERPVVMSTGMSTLDEVRKAAAFVPKDQLILLHTNSSYPCRNPGEINLRVMHALADEFGVPVGYSGHEIGLQITVAAVAMGACMVERHITLDRSMWGSDQAASVEPHGLMRLVRDVRIIEQAMGDGEKRVYDSELPVRKKLRRIDG